MLPSFQLFGLTIPMFGAMMMVGMLAAFALFIYTRRFIPFTEDQLYSCALWTIIPGFLGAKLLFWIVEFDQVLADPHYLLETLREGFVFYGALIGGVAGMLIYCARKKLPFFAFFDLFAPSLALAQAFGRIGCFCAGCCYGSPSGAACAVVYPPGSPAHALHPGEGLLPTQLFESAFLLVLTVVLILILRKKKTFGTVSGWYLILYGVWRFIIEFFRSDDRGFVGSLSTSQFIGIFIVLAGILVLLLIKRGVLHTRELPVQPAPEAEDAAEAEDGGPVVETFEAAAPDAPADDTPDAPGDAPSEDASKPE